MITQSIKNAILNIRDSVIYNTQLLIDREINSKQVYLKNSQQIFFNFAGNSSSYHQHKNS